MSKSTLSIGACLICISTLVDTTILLASGQSLLLGHQVDADACGVDLFPAHVARVAISGEDVEVEVDWSTSSPPPAAAILSLLDAGGNALTSLSLTPVAGKRTQHTFIRALVAVPSMGFSYLVAITDSAGLRLAEEHGFRVFLDCPTGGPCAYQAVDGMFSGGVVIRAELLRAIEAEEMAKSVDPLADVWSHRPDLRTEIDGLAWQLEQLDGRVGLDGCSCIWIVTLERLPQQSQDLDQEQKPWYEVEGSSGPGAGHALTIQAVDGDSGAFHINGETRLAMDLKCWLVNTWTAKALSSNLPSLTGRPVQWPQLTPCEPYCDGSVTHLAEIKAGLEAESAGGAAALSEISIAYEVENKALLAAAEGLTTPPEGKPATQLACVQKSARYIHDGLSAAAVLQTSGTAGAFGAAGLSAWARSWLHFQMRVIGEAQCAVEEGDVVLCHQDATKGLVIRLDYDTGNGGK